MFLEPLQKELDEVLGKKDLSGVVHAQHCLDILNRVGVQGALNHFSHVVYQYRDVSIQIIKLVVEFFDALFGTELGAIINDHLCLPFVIFMNLKSSLFTDHTFDATFLIFSSCLPMITTLNPLYANS